MSKKNIIQDSIAKVNTYQQNHTWLGFPYAVIKKYGDDEAGHQAALITYYGFLSLFPLLLVATTVLQMSIQNNPELQQSVLKSIGQYFPTLGDQLQSNIHTATKSGVALVLGLLFTLYGARGGADAFRNAINHIWHVPKDKRARFPKGALTSLSILLIGGMGLVLSVVLAGQVTGAGHVGVVKILSLLVSVMVMAGMFVLILKMSCDNKKLTYKNFYLSSVLSAIGIVLVQNFGTYLLTNQLKNLSTLYGTFAIVLGLLFWIYLQVQIVLYAVEIGTVTTLKLWPRSINDNLTSSDESIYASLVHKERAKKNEKIKVKFKRKK